ncbi:MAG: efflux RND transporter permease subunit [Acidobacteria bacterium]|nr:efflux RND transporter permease subunit [Acidobacteriota bacterium]MCB9399233.1 efflux RND transporter permease subunit [Acidobacteriota bacterium]
MIALSLRRPVTVFMAVLLILSLGYLGYSNLGRDLLPDIAYPSLTVMTKYEGAAPQEVEEFITKRLESALSTVKGKRKIESISREGISLITIEFQWGEDMQLAILHVREKLDIARFQTGFPQDAERPNILRWDPSSKPIVGLAISAPTNILNLRDGVHDVIKPRLEQLDGVALAQISGDVERVIDVEVDPQKISLYGLDLETVSSAIQRANGTIAGGTIKKGRYRYALRTLGEFDSVEEIAQVVVARRNGTSIRISDIARVRDTLKDREAMAFVNGTEAIGLLIYKEAGANTIETTKLVKACLEELKKTQPNYTITLAFEEAKFIEQALNNVWISLLFGGIFAFLVLVLFLGDLKSPIFIFLSIPISIVTTVALMYFGDVSLNIMSLGGLALGIGMLVDNSIVVLENIYRYREMGYSARDAAFQGAKEVAAPVTASTFTTIAVFFPIVYLKGITGELFGEQALTVTFSMLSSLVVSITVLPLLTALYDIFKGRDSLPAQLPAMPVVEAAQNPRDLWFWRWWEYIAILVLATVVLGAFKMDWWRLLYVAIGILVLPLVLFLLKWAFTFVLALIFQAVAFALRLGSSGSKGLLNRVILPVFNYAFARFEDVYHAVLVWALERKFMALSMSLIVLACGVFVMTHLKKELMPKSATGQFLVEMKLPPGSAIEVTADMVTRFEEALLRDSAVDVVFSQVGASDANVAQLLRDSGMNTAQLSVKLKPQYVSLAEVYRLSEFMREYGRNFPQVQLSFIESESSFEDLLAAEGGAGFQVQLEGERFDELYEANDSVLAALAKIDGLKDIQSTLTRDYPQIQVTLNREKIERYGFTVQGVGQFFSGGMRGAQATEFKEFDKRIDVRVRFPEAERENFDKILALTLTSPDGSPVPMTDLLQVEVIQGSKEIRRVDQKRVALISADLAGKKISEVVPAVQAEFASMRFPNSVSKPRLVGEQSGIQNSFSQLIWAFLLSSLLVYMIMAGQFESIVAPFVVIFTVPMGLIGTAAILWAFGQTINIMSLIGLVVLSGIVVNDAIVKVDFIKSANEAGMSIREAIFKASKVRLRPILMTTATTVLGLLPMAFGLMPYLVNRSFLAPVFQAVDPALVGLGLPVMSELFSGQGAEIQQPMALTIIGGLTCATLMTLVLIPLLYEVFMRDRSPQPDNTAEGTQTPALESAT